jgi:teichuronic acid biosynthesis glycosyltransferase TuaC
VGESIRRTRAESANEECILSAAPSVPCPIPRDNSEPRTRTSTRSLRVLTLTPFYPSAQDASQGSYIAEPLRATESLGITNHVIAVQPAYRPKLNTAQSDLACEWESYFSIPGNFGLPMAGYFLAGALKRLVHAAHANDPFDLIHAHSALPCGHAAELLSRELDIPFVVTVHGLDAFGTRQAGPLWGRWCASKSDHVYRLARVVICISEKVREQVQRFINVHTAVIYNGVDPQVFVPGDEASPLTVLSVGNLIPIKDHTLLLRAFAQASKSADGWRLEIIGDGPERRRLEHLAQELGIAAQVTFMGRQSRQFVADAMKRCAAFALPSRYEGLGCVYLEAMSSGKPAIGCTGQGIEEIIENGKTGMLVSPESLEELTQALRALLVNRDLRERLGRAARATILRRNTLQDQAAQIERVYRECVA